MPAVSTLSTTTDTYLNGLLTGVKWATGTLTYSFPTDASYYGSSYGSGEPTNVFEAFTSAQAIQVRNILKMYSSVVNLNFTEVTETASTHGDLRYAESDATATAWGYYPNTSQAGGDMWFNNSKNYYDNPVKGNYGYLTMMHETGHALGLKHPHSASGNFGILPTDHDSLEYTVMSYRSYVGGSTSGYSVAAGSYPQTLMMDDIAALQFMYGANYTTNSGDTVYRWDPATGQTYINGVSQGALAANKVFLTIWDGGGNDTYDFSNYGTGLKVSLAPGEWSTISSTQLAVLGSGKYAAGNIANAKLYQNNTASLIENVVGGASADTITGNTVNNKFTGNGGNDVLDGGAGTDTAVYSGLKSNYSLTANSDGSWTIVDLRAGSPDGTDTLKNMEVVQFADGTQTIGSSTVQPPPPPPPPSNSAPIMTSAAPTVSLTEWTDGSTSETNNTLHTASGSLTYSDADVLDLHTASFAAQGTGYLGTFSLNTASIDLTDTIGWSYSVSDSAMDSLAAGQTLTQRYNVTVSDGRGGTAMQTVTVNLAGAGDTTTTVTTNTAPVAYNDSYSTGKNKTLNITGKGVLGNDNDANGHQLNSVLVDKPKYGQLTLNADGSFAYKPGKNFVGTDSFTYKDTDGMAYSNNATVSISVGVGPGSRGNGADFAEGDSAHDHGTEHGDNIFEDQIPNPFGATPGHGPVGVHGFGVLALLAG